MAVEARPRAEHARDGHAIPQEYPSPWALPRGLDSMDHGRVKAPSCPGKKELPVDSGHRIRLRAPVRETTQPTRPAPRPTWSGARRTQCLSQDAATAKRQGGERGPGAEQPFRYQTIGTIPARDQDHLHGLEGRAPRGSTHRLPARRRAEFDLPTRLGPNARGLLGPAHRARALPRACVDQHDGPGLIRCGHRRLSPRAFRPTGCW